MRRLGTVLLLLLLASPAEAGDTVLDYAWRACQMRRATQVVNGRTAFGDYREEVRQACNAVAAELAARAAPTLPSQAEIDAWVTAAIAAAKQR